MKKLAILLLAFAFVGGTIMAQPEGLYAGGEIGFGDLADSDIELMDKLVIRPYVGIEMEMDAMELKAELGIPISPGDDRDLLLGVDLNLFFGYNLEAGPGVLGLSLENWTYIALTELEGEGGKVNTMVSTLANGLGGYYTSAVGTESIIDIGVKYTMGLDFGSLYFGLNVPFTIVATEDDDMDIFDDAMINFTVGAILMDEALDVGLTLYNRLKNEDDDFEVASLDLYGFYTMDALMAGITIGIPLYEDGLDEEGLSITLEAAYNVMENLKLYLKLPIGNIAADDLDVSFGLVIGAKFSF